MFSFFRKKTSEKHSFAFLGTDMHSHLIPGIDDGARTVEESVLLLDELKALGFNKLITTPHVYAELYPNTTQNIQEGLAALLPHSPVAIETAAEYFVDEHLLKLLRNDDVLCLKDRLFLMEYSFYSKPFNAEEVVFEALTRGYTPVIAHAERYLFLQGQVQKVAEWQEAGCLIQVNLTSLAGYYGPQIKHFALELLKYKAVDFAGTDLHHEKHLMSLQKLLKDNDTMKKLYAYEFKNESL